VAVTEISRARRSARSEKSPRLVFCSLSCAQVEKRKTGGIVMSEKDEKSGLKNWTVRMKDGSIRSFLAREKARFVDSNGGDMVVLEVFDPNAQYFGPIMEITGSLIKE
jgi:hypothetical protein